MSDRAAALALVPPGTPARRLLDDVCAQADAAGVTLILSPDKHTFQGGLACSGYFLDQPVPTLAVALGNPVEEWVPILAHESCHFDQWREGSTAWTGLYDFGTQEASVLLDQWLEGAVELEPQTLKRVIAAIQNVEHDAEKRTLIKMQAYGIPVDSAEYAQKSNAYVYFYSWVGETRRWSDPGRAAYKLEEIWRHAPAVFTGAVEACPPSLLDACHRAYPAPEPQRPRMRP